ncbi:YadA-like family protein [Streptobacillus felis]|uniref:YadA-like family protein n=2 Tax=Streptobacillus felis TaxID=1384509 RepID=UPI00082A9E37|nr:YadA-like family protein [Streptobacillus felis]
MKISNNLEKVMKSYLKRKITFKKETVILFLMLGTFAFSGYNNAALNSGMNPDVIPGSWILTNAKEETAKTIGGDSNIVLGKEVGGNITGRMNFIYGNDKAGEGTTGINNIIMGSEAGKNTSGHNNVALGIGAGQNVSGINNFAAGPSGAGKGVTGYYNIALGTDSGQNVGYAGSVAGLESSNGNTGMGRNNIAIGKNAGNGVQGNENIAIGSNVGENVGSKATSNSVGIYNVAIGKETGNNVQGTSNVSLGKGSGNNVEGSYNFIAGLNAGNGTKGSHNIIMGNKAGELGTVEVSETISIGTETKATKNNVTAIGYKAQALEEKTIALGGNSIADVANSIALGDNSKTEGTSSNRTKGTDTSYTKDVVENKLNLSFAGGDQIIGVLSVGNENETRRIQNVAPGLISENSTDAVNGSQLYALAKEVANLSNTSGVANNNIKLGGDTGETEAQNLDKENGIKFDIKGVTKDGVTYIVTKAMGDRVEIDLSEETKNKLNIQNYFHVNTGDPNQPLGSDSNLGTIDSIGAAKGKHSLSAGYRASSFGINSVAVGTEAASNGQYGVAIGHYSLVGENSSSSISIGSGSVSDEGGSIAIGKEAKAMFDNAISMGSNAESKAINSISIGSNSVAETEESIALGPDAKAIGLKAVSLGDKAIADIDLSVALGSNSKTTEAVAVNDATVGGLTYSGFAGNEPSSVVSVGNKEEGQYRQIQYVAAGQINKDSTDAINGSQLYATNLALSNLTKSVKDILGGNAKITETGDNIGNITITNIGNTGKDNIHDAIIASKTEVRSGDGSPIKVEKTIDDVDSHPIYTLDLDEKTKEKLEKLEKLSFDSSSGVANAVAMANLPQVSNIAGHRHNIAGAYGYYNGEHAFALGLSGLNETGNLVYKASGSLNTKGHVALGAGLGYQFDKLESRKKDMLTLQRNGNINLLDEKVYEHEIEIESLEKLNKELLEKVEKLEKMIQKLEK